METQSVYRPKSLERISSPEQLTDYLKVSTPAVWMLLLAVVLLLGGGILWAAFGSLETTVRADGMVQDGTAVLLLPEQEDPDKFSEGMVLRVNGVEGVVTQSGYTRDGRPAVGGEVAVADGYYSAEIVKERIRPIDFLFE